ncbi:hypothetical protein F0562_012371, partial [Nyssa sinensis]
MALFRKFFYRKPPDGLLEISERVFVFDCCFTTDVLEDDEYKIYIGGIVGQLREYFPDASFMVFNFREGEKQSLIGNILSEYDMTVMDYPRQYESCPLLTMEVIHHFLRSSESWLSLGQRNVLLMHCERGGWPVLAFMLAALLIYRKQYTGEQKTLEMIYKQAPRELLQLMSPLNPLPSQLRVIPNMDGEGGCRPIFRIYGQDPFMVADRTPKVLFSTPKRSKTVRYYKQADCELVKIDIHCHIQGDVVLECISLDNDLEREEMMFRVMFNTAFIRSNILMLNRDEIDILWNAKDQFPKDFRTEVLFSEMDTVSSLISVDLPGIEEKEGLPIEAFAKVQEIFSNVDWLDSKPDVALNMLQQINILQEKLEAVSPRSAKRGSLLQELSPEKVIEKLKSEASENSSLSIAVRKKSLSSLKPSLDVNSDAKKDEPQEMQVSLQLPPQSKIISQRISQIPLSAPASYCNLLQGSPAPISRYHSAPSALGITALLHDHTDLISKEVSHAVTISPPAASARFTHVSKPLQPSIAWIPPPSQSPSSLQLSMEGSGQSLPVSLPPHPPPSNSLSGASSSPSFKKSFSSPPPPPSPTFLSGAYPSPSTNKSFSRHPPPLPSPSLSGESPSPTIRNSFSSLPPHPCPPSPPPLPSFSGASTSSTNRNTFSTSPPPPPPPPPSFSGASPSPTNRNSFLTPPRPPSLGVAPSPSVENSSSTPPPPPPPPPGSSATCSVSSLLPIKNSAVVVSPPLPPPPPLRSGPASSPTIASSAPPPPPAPSLAPKDPVSKSSPHVPPVPPPPAPFANGLSKAGGASRQSPSAGSNGSIPPIPGPPFSAKGRLQSRSSPRSQALPKKTSLKPYHWLKLTRAMQGSLWAEAQKPDEASKAPEFDMSELESLFSASVPNSDHGSAGGKSNRRTSGPKSDKVQLIDLRRAYNCEIMLTKVKIPLPDLMSSVLALDDSALDVDQVDNLIKFCPTKEEMELLKNYNGDKENLGKCEQFFLELMKVPRVSDLRNSLNLVHSVAEEIRNSVKLKRIMQTILSLGNALNHGTARGAAIGFRLDSLLKLTDTRARNNKMTLMHYLCK